MNKSASSAGVEMIALCSEKVPGVGYRAGTKWLAVSHFAQSLYDDLGNSMNNPFIYGLIPSAVRGSPSEEVVNLHRNPISIRVELRRRGVAFVSRVQRLFLLL